MTYSDLASALMKSSSLKNTVTLGRVSFILNFTKILSQFKFNSPAKIWKYQANTQSYRLILILIEDYIKKIAI